MGGRLDIRGSVGSTKAPGYSYEARDASWIFVRVAQYDRPYPRASLPNGRSVNRCSLVARAFFASLTLGAPSIAKGSGWRLAGARRQGLTPPPQGGFRDCIRGVSLVNATSRCHLTRPPLAYGVASAPPGREGRKVPMSTCILHPGQPYASCAMGRTCQGNRVEVYPEPEPWETPF